MRAQTAWTVNNFTDTNAGTLESGGGFGPGNGSGNSGDLRYVLFGAMATGGVNTITFACSAPPCQITLAAPLPPIFETATTGAQAISSFNLSINGGSLGNVIIDGASAYRVFFVDNVAVTLSNLIIQNALAQGGAGGSGANAGGGGGAGLGAGLFVNQATANVVVQNTAFSNCTAVGGAGGSGTGTGFGGGGGLAFAGGNGNSQGAGGGGGVSGAGGVAGNGASGAGGAGGGGGGISNGSYGVAGTGFGDNAGSIVVDGVLENGGFGGGSGGLAPSSPSAGSYGGFGGGGGGSDAVTGGIGGFGGGGGADSNGYPGGSLKVGGVAGGVGGGTSNGATVGGGGGGAAAGPAIFVVSGSVMLYNVTGSGFVATPGLGGGGGATAGTANATPVFNYAGSVNGSASVGPIANAFTASAPTGQSVASSTTYVATLTFPAAVASGTAFNINVVTQGVTGLDFQIAPTQGQSTTDCLSGTAYAKGATCTVQYIFTPQFAGLRKGGITLTTGSGSSTAVITSALISGIGEGPQVTFAPATPVAIGSGFVSPFGLSVDAQGNVFVADSGVLTPKEILAAGGYAVVNTLPGNSYKPNGIAVDGNGNVFVANGPNVAELLNTGNYTAAQFATPYGAPQELAVDGYGNLFVVYSGNYLAELTAASGYTTSVQLNAGTGADSVAVDGYGNLFIGKPSAGDVVMLSASSGYTTAVPVGVNNLASNGIHVAVDASGNVYATSFENHALYVMPSTCQSSACVTTLSNAFTGPAGVAVDGAGNVFVADLSGKAVYMFPLATPPTLNFGGPITDGNSSSTQTVTVSNVGNVGLRFAVPPYGTTNPTTPNDFTFNTTSGSACAQLTNSSSPSTGKLAAGATCNLPLTFTPVAPANGLLTETLTLTDDSGDDAYTTIATTQSLTLTGTAVNPPPTITSLSQSSGPAIGGEVVTVYGSNFGTTPKVYFGSQIATNVVGGSGYITVTEPAGTPGTTVNVTVTTSAGTSTQVVPFMYLDQLSTANSTITASPNPAVAGSTVTVTATVVDVNNNPLNNETVTFTANSSTASFPNGTVATTNAYGVASVTLTDTASEIVALGASVGGAVSGSLNSTTATFVAPAYVVTTLTDDATGNGANCPVAGTTATSTNPCSLRDAIAAATTLTGVTADITFAPATYSGATAALPAVYYLSGPNAPTGGGTLFISGSMIITGPSDQTGNNLVAIDGGGSVRVLTYVQPGVINRENSTSNFLNNLILQNGNAVNGSGGGLSISYGSVSVSSSTVSNNLGGGVTVGSGKTLTMNHSTVSNNSALGSGGGIYAAPGSTLTLANSVVSGNSVNNGNGNGNGGGIYVQGTATITDSTISGNTAALYAGGMEIDYGSTVTLTNSTLSGNQAYTGGGILVGGGVEVGGETLTLNHSTISGNSAIGASGEGGGLYNFYGTVNLINSIVAGNSAASYPDIQNSYALSAPAGNIVNTSANSGLNPMLSALGNFGGFGQTMLPLPGSPAICAATGPGGSTDERGNANSMEYGGITCYDTGAVQTTYTLSLNYASPKIVLPGTPVTPAPVVTVREGGYGLSNGVVATIVMSDADTDLSSMSTTSVTTSLNIPQAAFPNLIFSAPEQTDSLIATLSLNPTLTPALNISVSSNPFQVGQFTPTIAWATPASITYGTALSATQLNATATYNNQKVQGTLTYTPAAMTVLNAGQQQQLSVTFTPSDTVTYAPVTSSVYLNVNPAPLAITASSATVSYGSPVPTITASYSSFANGDSPAALGTVTCNTTYSSTSTPGGVYTTGCSGAVDANYAITYAGGTVTVNAATPGFIVSPATTSINYGTTSTTLTANLTYAGLGTAPTGSVAFQIDSNAPVSVPLSSCSNASQTLICSATYATGTLAAAAHTISAVYSGDANYTTKQAANSLTVNPIAPAINFSIPAQTYGNPAITLAATSNSTGVITYSVASGNATINSATGTLTLTGAGQVQVLASQAANGNYTIGSTTATFSVAAATLILTAKAETSVYGSPLTQLTYSPSGLVPTDSLSSQFTVLPVLSTTATSSSPVNAYPITFTKGTQANNNYTVVYVNSTYTITVAPLVITASSPSMVYGTAVPAITASYATLVNGDTPASLSKAPVCTTTATSASKVSTTAYTTSCSSAGDENYAITYVNGGLTITQAKPTITWATPAAITYGTALSATQLDAKGSVAGTYLYSPASGTLKAGQQQLSVTFTPTDTVDYTSVTASVTLQVNQATPTITWANPAAINYGTALSTTQLNAMVNGVAGTFAYTPQAGTVLNGGTQSLSVTFTPTDTTDYTAATKTVSIVVNETAVQSGVSSGTQTYETWTNFVMGPGVTNWAKIPTGTVTLYDTLNGVQTALVTLPVSLDGYAYWTTNPPLNVGVNNLYVYYSGDKNFPPGVSSTAVITVLPAPVNFQVSCYNGTLFNTNPWTCSVSLSASTTTPPTGVFTYSLDGGAPVSMNVVPYGAAVFTVPGTLSAGTHTLVFNYAAQGNFAAAGPITRTTTVGPGKPVLQCNPSSWYLPHGSRFTLTGTITTPNSGIPTGIVIFYDNGVQIGTATIAADGTVSLTLASIGSGSHNFSASYAGGPNFSSSNWGSAGVTAY